MTGTIILAAVIGMVDADSSQLQPATTALLVDGTPSEIITVADRRYRRGYRQGYRRGYTRARTVQPYPRYYGRNYYRPVPRSQYYGTRRFRYYNYPYGRGSVRVGPVRIWW